MDSHPSMKLSKHLIQLIISFPHIILTHTLSVHEMCTKFEYLSFLKKKKKFGLELININTRCVFRFNFCTYHVSEEYFGGTSESDKESKQEKVTTKSVLKGH